MNKIYRVASATLAMVLLLLTMGSCSKENQLIPEGQLQAAAGQLVFGLDNNALRSTIPSEGFEKEVNPASVWCVFLTDSGNQTFKAAKQAKSLGNNKYTVDAGFNGPAKLFVIGNVKGELATELNKLTSTSSLSDVQNLVVKNTLGDGTTDPENFVMTSSILSVTLPNKGQNPAVVSDPIKLVRIAARFDVINEVPDLKLSSVSVANRILTATLFDVNTTGEKATGATEYSVPGGKELRHTIYSYQNTTVGGNPEATSFIINGNYDNKAIKPIKVELKDANNTGFSVQRNYCYQIIIKSGDGKNNPIDPAVDPSAWKVTIKVTDWSGAVDLASYSDEDLANLGSTTADPTVNTNGKNLLEAVAEYNIDVTGTKLTTNQTNFPGYTGYFTLSEAMTLAMPTGYHLPTPDEWGSILGCGMFAGENYYVKFSENGLMKDISITVQIPGQLGTMPCLQDVKQVGVEGVTYMIRYKNNDTYRSAWRYSYVKNGPVTGQNVLKIEAVPVTADVTIDQLNQEFFTNSKVSKNVKTIYLPTTGINYTRTGATNRESSSSSLDSYGRNYEGSYWAAMPDQPVGPNMGVFTYFWRFTPSNGVSPGRTSYQGNRYRLAVRPFRNL